MKAKDFCDKVFDGTHDTPKPVSNGKLLITSKHIANRCLDTTSAYYISEDDYNNINKRSRVQQYDVLFSMIGTVGNVYIERSKNIDYTIKNMGVFSCGDRDRALWLYYYLQSPKVKMNINSYLSGAVQKFVPLDFLRNLDIPDYSRQCKSIINVLTALDDKIALNKRINDKLEAMAKRLYDYWFVQFDFPDENGRPYKSSGGKMVWNETLKREIPAGWEIKRIDEITDIFNGSTPSTNNQNNYGGNIIWITPKDLSDQNSKFVYKGARNITVEGYNSCSTTIIPKGSIVMSSRAPIGLLSIAQCDLCTNQGFKNLVPKHAVDSYYLYYTLKSNIGKIQNLGTGTTFKEVSKDDLGRFSLLYPSNDITSLFTNKLTSLFAKQLLIEKQSARLTLLRDRLLPLLMNGQVEVK